jgi:hypothetical protein
MTEKLGVDDFFAAGGDGASLEAAAVPFDRWLAETAEDEEPEVGLVKELADAIGESESFAQNPGGKLYRFAGGVYKPHGAEYVRKAVKDLLEARSQSSAWSSHLASEVVEYLRVSAPLLWEQPPLDVVNPPTSRPSSSRSASIRRPPVRPGSASWPRSSRRMRRSWPGRFPAT